MKLKLIPAGKFDMGSDATDPLAEDVERVKGRKHRVRITRPFYLGATEVTVGQFRRFVERSNYKTEAERSERGEHGWNEAKEGFDLDPRYTWRLPGFPQTDDHPVTLVSWNDAVAFCEWLGQQEGQVYRLPTEAEWEYGCRAGHAGPYGFREDQVGLTKVGNVADGTMKESLPKATDYGIRARDGFVFTAPVGRLLPNAFGLFDMHGNVWEWCEDWYDEKYYAKSPSADPLNSTRAQCRVVRGGSWINGPQSCRSACRLGWVPDVRNCVLGFRVARVVRPGR